MEKLRRLTSIACRHQEGKKRDDIGGSWQRRLGTRVSSDREFSDAAQNRVCETSFDPIARDQPHINQEANAIWHVSAPDVTAVAEEQQVA
jgi:hypothetical protein